MRSYDIFALKLITSQGYPLAIGGICRGTPGELWEKRFKKITSLHLPYKDIYGVDLAIAKAIQEIGSCQSLLIAGCSLDVGASIAKGNSTGGVIGCPWQPIASSQGDCEILPCGFSLYTEPGGPGFAALADPAKTKDTVIAIKNLGCFASNEEIINCINFKGINTYLLVFDGSGSDTQGRLIAANFEKTKVISLI